MTLIEKLHITSPVSIAIISIAIMLFAGFFLQESPSF